MKSLLLLAAILLIIGKVPKYTIGTKKFGVGDFRLETTIIIKMESQRQSFYPIHFDSFLWAKKNQKSIENQGQKKTKWPTQKD